MQLQSLPAKKSTLDAFFNPPTAGPSVSAASAPFNPPIAGPAVSAAVSAVKPNANTVSALTAPLPLPPAQSKLTRSELFFKSHTEIHPNSLIIDGDSQFYLFMEMRAEQQWVSFNMTPAKWVLATEAYNTRLALEHPDAVQKNPKALLKKLSDVESLIEGKIAKQDFSCMS